MFSVFLFLCYFFSSLHTNILSVPFGWLTLQSGKGANKYIVQKKHSIFLATIHEKPVANFKCSHFLELAQKYEIWNKFWNNWYKNMESRMRLICNQSCLQKHQGLSDHRWLCQGTFPSSTSRQNILASPQIHIYTFYPKRWTQKGGCNLPENSKILGRLSVILSKLCKQNYW